MKIDNGIVIANDPIIELYQEWNNVSIAFTGIKFNATDTNSAAGSLIADFQIGAVSKASITKAGFVRGLIFQTGNGTGPTITYSGDDLAAGSSNLTTLTRFLATAYGINSAASYTPMAILTQDGAGLANFRNSTTSQTLRITNTYTDASNYEWISINPGITSGWMQIVAQTAGTGVDNISLAFTPAGTGALSAHVPDSGVGGGNARGANATDWQTLRNAATQVASGAYSIVLGGAYCTASGSNSIAGGYQSGATSGNAIALGAQAGASGTDSICIGSSSSATSNGSVCIGSNNTASGQWAFCTGILNVASGDLSWIPGGYKATTRSLIGSYAYASGSFGVTGDAQIIGQPVRLITTTTGASQLLTTDAAAESATNVMVLPINSGALFTATLTAVHGAGVAVGGWKIEGSVRRGASGNAILDYTPSVTTFGVGAALGTPVVDVAVLTGSGAGAIGIVVTPANTTSTNWVGKIELTQVVKA